MTGLSRIAGYAGFAVAGALLVTVAVQMRRPAMPERPVATGSPPRSLAQPAAPLPLSPPVADFPYVFAGRARAADGSPLVMLARDSQLLTLAVGGVIDNAWRVEAITDDGVDLVSVPDGKPRHLRFTELTQRGETVLSQSQAGGGAALREIVVDARDTAKLQALAANPPAGALIRIVGGDPAVRPTAPLPQSGTATPPVLQTENAPRPPGPETLQSR